MRNRSPPHLNTYTVGLSQGCAASLGHPYMTEFSFLNKFSERPYRVLNRNAGVNSSTLEEVQILCPSEVFVDIVNATPHACLAAVTPPFNGQEGFLRVFRVLLVECSEQVQVG